jgi:hypothetical protein
MDIAAAMAIAVGTDIVADTAACTPDRGIAAAIAAGA